MEKGILIDTKDDKEYGIVRELNNIEKVFLKFVSNNNAIPITILRLKHRIDNEIFKKAVYLVCDKNELLHSCITKKNGKDCIKKIDHSTLRYEYRESDDPLSHTGIDINKISGKESYILSITLNNQSDCSDIATCFNHVLFDGISLEYIMDDIYRAYISLVENKIPKISERKINLIQFKIYNLEITENLIKEFFFNIYQRSLNIFIKASHFYSHKNTDIYLQNIKYYFNQIIDYLHSINILEGDSNRTKILSDDYFDKFKDYQVNNLDKIKILPKNSDINKKTFLTTQCFSREITSNLLKQVEKNDVTLFPYICSLLSRILHKNFSTCKTQKIQIQTYLNLRFLKQFDYSGKPQGLLILPLLFNTNCTEDSSLSEQGKEIFANLSNITGILNPSTTYEIYRKINILNQLFYKNYLDSSKFGSKYIDIMVNNLGILRQYNILKIKKYETIICYETDLTPKINLYFYISKGELHISLSTAYIEKIDHEKILGKISNKIRKHII